MGTRHLIIAIIDKKVKIAQYGQWDGYLQGQGIKVVDFIQEANLRLFKKRLRECMFLSSRSVRYRWKKVGAIGEWLTMEQSNKFRELYPELSRDTGAEILDLVHFYEKRKLVNAIGFAAESLFCEWAYVLNMDRNVLEIYKGFNSEPLKKRERFYNLQCNGPILSHDKKSKYYPIKCIAKIPFKEATREKLIELDKKLQAEKEED